ncbi:PREDICTED: uncharacterized protein LOC106123098 [Papilio xuthus]|uniref:Uncharacterized protein LOC106123098 n=1 Tax=Papilio xuthus TaxID=66420 RepID=A0AAJ6ZKU3_PAPXU|nr:PREDICTED: uncharacterized protein LOC106123098 [Papilio xuthus]
MDVTDKDKISVIEESIATVNRPLPDDFRSYLPWACNQLELEYAVFVNKIHQSEHIDMGISDRSKGRTRSKARTVRSRADGMSDRTEDMKTGTTQQVSFVEEAINITAVHDSNGDLVQIVFCKNKHIPRIVIKIIGLIIKFHPQLNSVEFDQGANLYTIYEFEKILPLSNITEVCFDGTYIPDANYDILLDHELLRYLSLSRCKIEDEIIHNIAMKLVYPNPASKSLAVLNLSSNRITNDGAKSLAFALRSNRCLIYLNLSANKLTDEGAASIMDSLQEFCLTPEEILASKSRYCSFYLKRNKLIAKKVKELKESDSDKSSAKKKGTRSVPPSVRRRTKTDREVSLHSVHEILASNITGSESNLFDRAATIVQMAFGVFIDPFSSSNTIVKDEALYCLGNNSLLCLNLAYNDLSYIFVRKLLGILLYQKQADRKPRGLINVCIEGNNLPVSCEEYRLIEGIIESGVQRNLPINKKRQQSKVVSR